MIEHRVLASGRVRRRVRHRTPDYRQRSPTFDRKTDAEAFAAEVRGTLRRGDFADPQRGRITLARLWAECQQGGMPHLRATTQQNYRMAFRYVLERPVAKIGHADVAEWVSTLSTTKGPETVSTSTGCLPRRLRDAHASAERQRRPGRPIALPDLRSIQLSMGHEPITTTARIYAHLYDDELDAVAAALDGLRKGAS